MKVQSYIHILLIAVGLAVTGAQAVPYYISGQVAANAFPDDYANLPVKQNQVVVTSLIDSMLATSSLGNYGLSHYEANHASAIVRAEVYAQNAQRSETEYDWANASGYVMLVDELTFTMPAGAYVDGVAVTLHGYYSLYMEATGRGQARGMFMASIANISENTGTLEVAGVGGTDTLSIAQSGQRRPKPPSAHRTVRTGPYTAPHASDTH